MRFESRFNEVEAVPVELSGEALMAVNAGGRAHCIPAEWFTLLFQEAPKRQDAPAPAPQKRFVKRNGIPESSTGSRLAAEVRLRGYPEALRDPRSTTLRAVWDALGIEPSSVSGIERTTGLGNKQVSMALMGLRDKCLVHKRDSDGAWERTREE